MAQSDSYSDLPISASNFRASRAPEHPQRRHPPLHPKHTPTSLAPTAPAPSPPPPRPPHRPQSAASHWQTALFRATAPPILFSILIAGLLVELRARLAQPLLPAAPPGLTVSVSMRAESDSAVQRALMWTEGRWPGAWALPVLCAVALGALRVVIWAGAAVLDRFVERADVGRAARVRVGRWEDGGSVSGSELLAGMFT